jgi:hypothetical protein
MRDMVDMLRYVLGFYGNEITEEHHGLTKDGLRHFGLLCLESKYGDYEATFSKDGVSLATRRQPISNRLATQVMLRKENINIAALNPRNTENIERIKSEIRAMAQLKKATA